jgi:hypothetical protein
VVTLDSTFLQTPQNQEEGTKAEATMGEALSPSFQEVVARQIANEPNTLQFIN